MSLRPGPVRTLHAAPHWRCVDLVSDLHLGPATPRTAAALADYLGRTCADAVLVLGDLFEVWIGDDALDTPADTQAEAEVLHRFADFARHRTLAMLVGNRDFLLGARAAALAGWQVLDEVCVLDAFGRRTVLVHGDAQCLADQDYQHFRQQARSPAWQQAFLAQPLAQRRVFARGLRDGSEHRKQTLGLAAYPDLDRDAMCTLLRDANATTLVHGHTHRPGDESIGDGLRRHVLTDWDLDHDPAAPRAEVLRLSAGGATRLSPERADQPPC
ncbi:UDP-2,3-diacylglucosamine diphosphatase [Sphaerotilus sp.]|uniref:UDP-2,3-diacylglucosamine diphosphatase n=1 Tax=Sphaerotilus sp. TaxID=2093942 RepID=UPI002ACEDC53|nr:UDP-2,3-diacylglucosamine diphosphatase [Sphaerotilus sp.]MDZ7855985.1 UDP-2,3-diacylglucosamine diphosphatase [Sphaerotilus sp.]